MANDETMTPDNPDTVWANTWNPPTDEWSPTAEPHNTWGVAQPGHGDLSMANPMVDAPGDPRTVPPTTGGSVPDVRDNLLTDVKNRMQTPAPAVEVHHVVENVERGAESVNVRQITVVGNVAPTQLLESNPNRRRALVRVVPSDPAIATANNNLTAAPPPATLTVPAGKTWTLQSISFLYTAGAGVGNRNVSLTIKDAGGRTLYTITDTTALTATQAEQVVLSPGLPQQRTGAGPFTFLAPLPTLTLQPGSTITATATGVDPSDVITNGVVMFTQGSVSGGSGGSVFVAARQQPGSASAPQTWFKLVQGDAPLEVKSQDGIDGIGVNSTDSIAIQVYEELVGARPDTPGVGL